MRRVWVDVCWRSANIGPSNATGVRVSAHAPRKPRRFGALNRVLRFCRGPQTLGNMMTCTNLDIRIIGSIISGPGCISAARTLNGQLMVLQAGGCLRKTASGFFASPYAAPAFCLMRFAFLFMARHLVFCPSLPFFPSNVRLRGRSSTTRAAPPPGNAAGKERQGK